MLSVTSATIHHHTMCPSNTTTSSGSGQNGIPSWNCVNVIPKNCRDELVAASKNNDFTNTNNLYDELKSPSIETFIAVRNEDRNTNQDKTDIIEIKKEKALRISTKPLNKRSLSEIDEIFDDEEIPDSNDISEKEFIILDENSNSSVDKKKKTGRTSQPVKFLKMSMSPKENDDKVDSENVTEKKEVIQNDDYGEMIADDTILSEKEFNQLPIFSHRAENWDEDTFPLDSHPTDFFADNLYNPENSYKSSYSSEIPYYMIGFPNPPGENRCWLNATLHVLFALPLVDKLDSIYIKNCSKLTKTLVAMQLFWKQGSSEKLKFYQTITKFKKELNVLDASYPSERQQDVSEFLMIFLNHVQTDFEKIMTKKSNENSENHIFESSVNNPIKRAPLAVLSPFKRRINYQENVDRSNEQTDGKNLLKDDEMFCTNPIDEYFLLNMMEHYICQGCSNHRQQKIDNLMLYVDLPENELDSIDLAESVNKSIESEERTLTCGKCRSPKHNVHASFRESPNILIVQVKRYGMTSDGYVAKINTPVRIPQSLNLDINGSVKVKNIFEPVCIIAHVGAAMDCGHYTSYVKHGNQWYHYNDLHVMPMTNNEALQAAETTAYLIFFVNKQLLEQSTNNSDVDEQIR
ncbi:hypothetical protein HCN44_007746 [Aphidius gifuensis]|uniref:ubiquitinyl hydrolase 1 n=1 Tax=Aphidius gifuensis TaxID=684658 RepID=A0A834XM25_APHGI|nr:ubiquitin carboxyl-terminal hydrolase 4-like [Aphidius gifuensis]KAF7989216.1 hypothetical protein HCN44_007746 [Aphidius gifuensis]